jgi:hypothetical protein
MALYKRNQIEEAISRTFEEASSKPSSALRTRIKRLLELDRSLGRNKRATNPELAHYAFYSEESPGRGAEVQFSAYEAFALMTALQFLEHGWPQSYPVDLLRRHRPELERQHARIIKQDPALLFDEETIRRAARPGQLYIGNTDPVFLVIVTPHPTTGSKRALASGIFHGMEKVYQFLRHERAEAYTLHDLVRPAHSLLNHLAKAPPRKRGRAG